MRKIVAVVGDAIVVEGSEKERLAFEAGKAVIDAGFRLQCGGMNGVMRAACRGAHASEKYKEGDVIGILPGFKSECCNEYVDIAIPTGLDLYRNVIVGNASAVVAVGGGSGTLTEMAHGWAMGRMICAFGNSDGWAEKLAGERLDHRVRYENIPDDKIYDVRSGEELKALLLERIDRYDTYYRGIPDEVWKWKNKV